MSCKLNPPLLRRGGALFLTPLLLGATEAHLQQGIDYFRAGDLRAARVELMNAVKADPASGPARLLQARVAIGLGDGETAEGALVQARTNGIPAAETQHLLAHALLLEGRYDDALAAAAPDRIPPKFAIYGARMRARAELALGRLADAATELNAALKAAPNDPALWVDLARLRLATGDLGGAIQASARSVELAPGSAEALTLRATLVRTQYGLAASLPWFERALAADKDNVEALVEQAATFGELGRAGDMLAASRRALALDPGNARALYMQAAMAARAGDVGLARGLMTRVGDKLGEAPGVLLLKGVLALQAGNPAEAATQLDRLVALQPDNSRARTLLGLAHWRQGDADGTRAALQPLADRPDADPYVLRLIARACEALEDRAAAGQYLDRANAAERAQPQPLPPRPDLGAPAAAEVRADLLGGRIADALAHADAARRAVPGAPAAQLLWGDALAAAGRNGDAARAFADAAGLRFSESIALRLIAAERRAGDDNRAWTTLALYLGQNPESVSALLLYADLLVEREQWDDAARLLESLRARLGGHDAALLAGLSAVYHGQGDDKRALLYARAAYALAPADARVCAVYAQALATAKDERAGAMAAKAKLLLR